MNKINIKENRYNLIKKSLHNRIFKLKQDLAYDLQCEVEQIPDSEWENYLLKHLKRPLDDFWGNEDVAYYLFDKLINEEAKIPSWLPKNIKHYFEMWQV